MTVSFYRPAELNGSSYVKLPLKPSAILNIEIDDKYCSLWLKLAKLHTCENNHHNQASNYRQNFDEINNEAFGLIKALKCSDAHEF